MFTHIQFALTCHPCARSPQYLARCKGTVNTVEWTMLAAQNVKTPMVTKAPHVKQFSSSRWLKAVEADRRHLSTKDNAISQQPSGHTWRHFWLPQLVKSYRNLPGGSYGCCSTTSKAPSTSPLSSNSQCPKQRQQRWSWDTGEEASLSQKRKCSKWDRACGTNTRVTDTVLILPPCITTLG